MAESLKIANLNFKVYLEQFKARLKTKELLRFDEKNESDFYFFYINGFNDGIKIMEE